MINRKELAICKRRGHDPHGYREKWERCKHCGMWTRTVSVKEEREDEPPNNEQDPMYEIGRQLGELERSAIARKAGLAGGRGRKKAK